jgi:F-type H+-transporting ATPase subunit delta
LASQGAAVSSGPASRYAAAVYAQAEEVDRLNPVITNLERLGRLLDASPDLTRVVTSAVTDASQARRALHAIIRAQELGIMSRRLVDVLVTNRRLPLLRPVIAAFAALVAQKRGITTARVTTAHPISGVQEQQLRARLIEMGYGNVRIERDVDPSLLGGLVVRVGSRLYDSSLKSRLQRLQYAMKEAG